MGQGNGPNLFLDEEESKDPTDTCGDMLQGLPVEVTSTFTVDCNNIDAGTGTLTIDSCRFWDANVNDLCDTTTPNVLDPPKCDCTPLVLSDVSKCIGKICNDENPCTVDTCTEATGACVYSPVGAGTACGDQTDTECDDPNTCDAAGVCQPNFVDAGTVCTDGDATDCRVPQCDGSGTCDPDYAVENEGTACGDQTDTECDDPNTCDAAGVCQPNFVDAGTVCTDGDATDCLVPQCDGSGTCDPDYAVENEGTACGDQTDTECDDPNTCDAAGVCQPNLVDAGTVCTDGDATDCRIPQCDGSGTCDPDYAVENEGTACGDQTDTECDDPNTCDAAGVCQPNLVDAGTYVLTVMQQIV